MLVFPSLKAAVAAGAEATPSRRVRASAGCFAEHRCAWVFRCAGAQDEPQSAFCFLPDSPVLHTDAASSRVNICIYI